VLRRNGSGLLALTAKITAGAEGIKPEFRIKANSEPLGIFFEREFDKTAIRVYYKHMDKYQLEYRKNSVFLLLFPMRRDII
jgi:hypothetical protein